MQKNNVKIRKINMERMPGLAAPITYKKCGNIVETIYISRRNSNGTIQRISKDEYIVLSTGEIKQFEHGDNRADNLDAVRVSLRKLRDYINTNVTNPRNCLWITLTYAENMTDTLRLYTDFDKFNKRLRYRIGEYEYIVAMEPQGRGAWHAHLLLIFEDNPPFIPNEELRNLWGHGFVKINKLKGKNGKAVDNIGAYLTAYLGDIEFIPENVTPGATLKKVETATGKTKRFIKGGRLHLYPAGFNLYRISKGIKAPVIEVIPEFESRDRLKNCKLTYEKAIEITLDNGDKIIIYYRNYNLTKRTSETTSYVQTRLIGA